MASSTPNPFNPITTDPASVSQAGSGLSSTDLADINEGMAYLTLINPRFIATNFLPAFANNDFTAALAALKKLSGESVLSESDRISFEIIESKFVKVATLPADKITAGAAIASVKAEQGINEAIYISNTFPGNIDAVYFTNTRARLVKAIEDEIKYRREELGKDVSDLESAKTTIVGNIMDHPADIMIIQKTPSRAAQRLAVGISLKASFKPMGSPTICNLGMNSTLGPVYPLCPGEDLSTALSLRGNVLVSNMEQLFNNGAKDAIAQGKINFGGQALPPDSGLMMPVWSGEPDRSARIGGLLKELLHLQDGNIDYCLVAASGEEYYGINFTALKHLANSPGVKFDVAVEMPPTNTKRMIIQLQTIIDSRLIKINCGFSLRIKKAGSRTNTLKINITLDKTFNALLKTPPPAGFGLSPGLGQSTGASKGGAKLRSGTLTGEDKKAMKRGVQSDINTKITELERLASRDPKIKDIINSFDIIENDMIEHYRLSDHLLSLEEPQERPEINDENHPYNIEAQAQNVNRLASIMGTCPGGAPAGRGGKRKSRKTRRVKKRKHNKTKHKGNPKKRKSRKHRKSRR